MAADAPTAFLMGRSKNVNRLSLRSSFVFFPFRPCSTPPTPTEENPETKKENRNRNRKKNEFSGYVDRFIPKTKEEKTLPRMKSRRVPLFFPEYFLLSCPFRFSFSLSIAELVHQSQPVEDFSFGGSVPSKKKTKEKQSLVEEHGRSLFGPGVP